MPLGPYEDFGQCVQAQKMKGHSDESAHKICGAMEQKIGSSQEQYGFDGGKDMSEKPEGEENKPKGVTISEEQLQALAEAAFEQQDLAAVQEILKDIANIEGPEEQPQKAPPPAA
jgi:hypothetical protein